MDILIKALQFLLSLSIIVVLHEGGHFLPAKLFGMRVEKFYLFFDAYFSVFKKKIGDTIYGIGWLPLGGYVKISGMVDESMDKEQMAKEPEPWEFRSKPAWQRLIVMVGGVTVNVILGFIIYIGLAYSYGDERLPITELKYGVYADSVLYDHGFEPGDKIVSVGQDPEVKYFSQITKKVLIDGVRNLTIERDGKQQEIVLPSDVEQELLNANVQTLFAPRVPFELDTAMAGMPAAEAGLVKSDRIIAVNGEQTLYAAEVTKAIKSRPNEEIEITFIRDGLEQSATMTVNEEGLIGIGNKSPNYFFTTEKIEYSILEAVPAGIQKGTKTLTSYVSSMKLIFTEAGARSIGGFGTLGNLFPSSWDARTFWSLTAFLSMILAFMNILPIPALDGGHVMFLLYEMVTGRKPNDKFMEYAQMTGMLLLFGLLLYANGNDIFKIFFK